MKPANLEELNSLIREMIESAQKLMPNDFTLMLLTRSIPAQVTEQNARESVAVMGLISRMVARRFNDLAQEQEKLVQEWES